MIGLTLHAQTLPQESVLRSQEISLIGRYAQFCCIALTITRVSAAAFLGIKLFTVVYRPAFTSTPLFEALGETSGCQKLKTDIGFRLKLRWYQKVLEDSCSWAWLYCIQHTGNVKLIYLMTFSADLVLWWIIGINAIIEIACIQCTISKVWGNKFINFHTENDVLCNVQCAGLLCDLQQYRPSFHIYNTSININPFCKIGPKFIIPLSNSN